MTTATYSNNAPLADRADGPLTTGPTKGIRLRFGTIAAVVVAVALAGAGVGATLKDRAATRSGTAGANAAAPGPNGNGFPGGGFTRGTVTKVDGTTIQLTDANGAAVTVTVPSSATITANQAGAVSDITVGSSVMVAGTTAADGTTTAGSVTVSPAG